MAEGSGGGGENAAAGETNDDTMTGVYTAWSKMNFEYEKSSSEMIEKDGEWMIKSLSFYSIKKCSYLKGNWMRGQDEDNLLFVIRRKGEMFRNTHNLMQFYNKNAF